jgi:hypothetical protein
MTKLPAVSSRVRRRLHAGRVGTQWSVARGSLAVADFAHTVGCNCLPVFRRQFRRNPEMTYNRPSQSSIVHSTTDVLASLLENGDVQRLFLVIKLIKSAGPDVDVIGQVIDRRPLQSVLREQSLPRVEQLVADALAFLVGETTHENVHESNIHLLSASVGAHPDDRFSND